MNPISPGIYEYMPPYSLEINISLINVLFLLPTLFWSNLVIFKVMLIFPSPLKYKLARRECVFYMKSGQTQLILELGRNVCHQELTFLGPLPSLKSFCTAC